MEEERVRVWFWRIWTAVGAGVFLFGVWWLLRDPVLLILPPLAIAAVIVYLLNPVVGSLERRGIPRLLGVALSYLVGSGVLVGVSAIVGPILADQGEDLLEELPAILVSLQDAVNAQLARFGFPDALQFDPNDEATRVAIQNWVAENRDQLFALLRGAGSVAGKILHALLTLVLAPILAFYALVDLPRISDGIKRLMPPGPRGDVLDVAQRITVTVGAYFRGQLMVAAFVGVATTIGLGAIRLPFWAIVGLLAGLFNLIPLIGPFVGGSIGVIIALTVGGGFQQAVAVVIAMTIVQQIDNHVITPNVISRSVRVHPITVILGLVVAGSLYGILGMFVAIPAIAAAKLIIMYVLVTRFPSMRHLAGEGPGLFDHEARGGEAPEGTLVALGRDIRATWERRRSARDPASREDRER